VADTLYVPGGKYTTAGCVVSIALMFRPWDKAWLMAFESSAVPSPTAPNALTFRKVVELCKSASSYLHCPSAILVSSCQTAKAAVKQWLMSMDTRTKCDTLVERGGLGWVVAVAAVAEQADQHGRLAEPEP
jgi:hypothetical protein